VVVGGRQSGTTRRLGAIAGQGGQPVFMVESDDELDLSRLAGLDEVGVSAGASTPNWMINQVVRRLEGLRGPSEARLGYWLRRTVRFLVRSQVVVAVGAGAMVLAGGLMQGFVTPWPLAAAAFCYFFAMHVMNNFLDREAQQYNDPDKVRFMAAHRSFLVSFAVLAAAAAPVFNVLVGWPLAMVTALMVGAGLLYTAPLVPARWRGRLGFASLKDLPGSKTVSASMAWGIMAVLLPAWAVGQLHPLATPLAYLFAVCLALVRYTIFDILDAQGDLIVGKETIPLVLGLARAERLMSWLLSASALMLLAAVALGPAPLWSLGLLLPVAWLWTMRLIYGRDRATGGSLLEALVDAGFWLAGLVALTVALGP
jgi:4-hydroxy-3-methylbut-2-enyl diphosphate reductase